MDIGDVRLSKGCIEWGKYSENGYQFYIEYLPNWLPEKYRYWGSRSYWYDGPHRTWGFWYFNIGWSLPGDDGRDIWMD